MENRISIVLPKQVEEGFLSKMGEAFELIKPYVETLSDKERVGLLRIGDYMKSFVQKTLDYAKSDPEFCPGFLDVAEFGRDVSALDSFIKLSSSLDKLQAGVVDTKALLGNDAYVEATVYYRSVKEAARMGNAKARVIYDDLSRWFPGRSTGAKSSGGD